MPKVKQRAIKKAEYDRKQTMLASTTTGVKIKEEPSLTADFIRLNPDVCCPFCLHLGKIRDFRVPTKHGYSKKRAQCPECNNLMQIRSLTQAMSPEQYAQWVFDYSLSGFWQKCPFHKFADRLKRMGISYRFWAKYKQLKGEANPEESYQEYLKAQQEKWAKKKGLIK